MKKYIKQENTGVTRIDPVIIIKELSQHKG